VIEQTPAVGPEDGGPPDRYAACDQRVPVAGDHWGQAGTPGRPASGGPRFWPSPRRGGARRGAARLGKFADMGQDQIIRHEVSRHEVAVYQVLAGRAGTWMTSTEIARAAKVAPRTARAHVTRLAALGVLDVADEVFPGRRYRLAADAGDGPRSYADRLRRAAEVLGVGLQGSESAEPETVSFVVRSDDPGQDGSLLALALALAQVRHRSARVTQPANHRPLTSLPAGGGRRSVRTAPSLCLNCAFGQFPISPWLPPCSPTVARRPRPVRRRYKLVPGVARRPPAAHALPRPWLGLPSRGLRFRALYRQPDVARQARTEPGGPHRSRAHSVDSAGPRASTLRGGPRKTVQDRHLGVADTWAFDGKLLVQ
jgi:hypothetical protein